MKARVVFTVRLREGQEDTFLQAYEAIRKELPHVKGHLVDQLCQSTRDPRNWVITSEWESEEVFWEWEHSQGHRELVQPMLNCFEERNAQTFVVRLETTH